MSDKLRARAQELAEIVDRDLNSAKSINVDPVAHIKSAILAGMREALREEPDDAAIIAGQCAIPPLPHYEEYKRLTGNQDQPWCYAKACYMAMAEARARGLE